MKSIFKNSYLLFVLFIFILEAQALAQQPHKTFEGGNNIGNIKTGLDTTDITTNFPINKPEDIKATLNTDGTAVIDITGAGGQTQKIPVEQLPTTYWRKHAA